MNRLHLRKILVGWVAVSLLTACTNDEGLTQGEPLPPGKYPLELTAGGLQAVATPVTRGTVDGDWDGVKRIAVRANKSRRSLPYKVKASEDKKTALLTPEVPLANDDYPFWWTSTTKKKLITAWYPNSEAVPAEWSVPADQSHGLPADKDFLYACKVASFYEHKGGVKMQFYHQLAKVVVNIRNTDFTADRKITSVKLDGVYLSGNYTAPEYYEEGWPVQGLWEGTGKKEAITMNGMEAAQDADFGDGTEPAKASYTALVIPQLTKDQDIRIKIGINGATYAWSLNNVLAFTYFEGGNQYTFNIIVRAEGLSVFSYKYPTWEEGDSENIEIEV